MQSELQDKQSVGKARGSKVVDEKKSIFVEMQSKKGSINNSTEFRGARVH